MAPEILGIEQIAAKPRTPTPQSDVFALGMVAIEVIAFVLSDARPFLNNLTRPGVHGASAVP